MMGYGFQQPHGIEKYTVSQAMYCLPVYHVDIMYIGQKQ